MRRRRKRCRDPWGYLTWHLKKVGLAEKRSL
jgi:hypothetical protein